MRAKRQIVKDKKIIKLSDINNMIIFIEDYLTVNVFDVRFFLFAVLIIFLVNKSK